MNNAKKNSNSFPPNINFDKLFNLNFIMKYLRQYIHIYPHNKYKAIHPAVTIKYSLSYLQQGI